MPKFYVSTGCYQTIVDAPDVQSGAQKGFERIVQNNDFPPVGEITSASERGFEIDDKTWFICTDMLIVAAGWQDEYLDDSIAELDAEEDW